MPKEKPHSPRRARSNRRLKIHWRLVVLAGIVGCLMYCADYRPDAIASATAPYRFSAVTWELRNLPDKWVRRIWAGPMNLLKDQSRDQRLEEVEEFFGLGMRLREIDRQLIQVAARRSPVEHTAATRRRCGRNRRYFGSANPT